MSGRLTARGVTAPYAAGTAPSRTASRPIRASTADARLASRCFSRLAPVAERDSNGRALADFCEAARVRDALLSAWHARSVRKARRLLAHGRGRTLPRRPAGFESAFEGLLRSRGRCAASCCGRRAIAQRLWPPAVDLAGWASLPLVPPRRAASRAALGSSSSFRPFGCGPPLSAGLPVRSCRPPRHFGAGCGGWE